MRVRATFIAAVVSLTAVALMGQSALAVVQYTGALGSLAVDPAFAAASASHAKQLIDFDGDGFVLSPHTFTPIPTDHYAA